MARLGLVRCVVSNVKPISPICDVVASAGVAQNAHKNPRFRLGIVGGDEKVQKSGIFKFGKYARKTVPLD